MKPAAKVMIKEHISIDLALRDSADTFFNYLESIPQKEIIVDFNSVKSISRSFAHEYITRKSHSKKSISETNVPENVKKMFFVIEQPAEKTLIFDLRTIKTVTL